MRRYRNRGEKGRASRSLTPEKKQTARNEIRSALIATLVAVILSPLSLTISNKLNQHFSRADLSIENVDAIREETMVSIPLEAFTHLLNSEGFRGRIARSMENARRVAGFEHIEKGLSEAQFRSFKKAIIDFQEETKKREARLAALIKDAEVASSAVDVQVISAGYLDIPVEFAPKTDDPKKTLAELSPQLTSEHVSTEELLVLIDNFVRLLDAAEKDAMGQLYLKVSILNRGSSDGLVRNQGVIVIASLGLRVPITRTTERKAASPLENLAVPVSVVSSSDEGWHSGSVGKVEKNSMSEYWFALDRVDRSPRVIMMLRRVLSAKNLGECQLILYDQERHPITSHWIDRNELAHDGLTD